MAEIVMDVITGSDETDDPVDVEDHDAVLSIFPTELRIMANMLSKEDGTPTLLYRYIQVVVLGSFYWFATGVLCCFRLLHTTGKSAPCLSTAARWPIAAPPHHSIGLWTVVCLLAASGGSDLFILLLGASSCCLAAVQMDTWEMCETGTCS